MKFTVKENRIFLNEDIEVYLFDNYAFMEENRQTLNIYGASKKGVAISKYIKGLSLLDVLKVYKKGNIIALTVDGTKSQYVIQNLEIDLLSQEYKKGAINPNNYILSIYVYEVDAEDPQDKTILDERYFYISMDYGDEAEAEKEESLYLFE